jgi:Mg2+ and Co2+ transporter CorA
MKIEKIYLGTWFQRTSLHLKEIYNFLKNKKGVAGLDQNKLDKFWEELKVEKISFYEKTNFDFLEAKCDGVTILITEDGIVLLSLPAKELHETIASLENFYSQRFGPVLSYLFSRGAPLPKQLEKAKEIYPLIGITKNLSSKEEAKKLFREFDDEFFSSVSSKDIEIFFGQVLNLFNVKQRSANGDFIEELLLNIVFFREFQDQLNRYLNLHRTMWDRISRIRESKTLRYKDFPYVRQQILEFLKTLSFVKARLSQMDDIIAARILLINPVLKKKLPELGFSRFEHLEADQKYVSHLWQMTIEYVDGTLNLLESLFQENTQRELGALKFVTLIAALTGFFGMNIAFPWEERWLEFFPSSFVVIILIILLSLSFYFLLKKFVRNRHFKIK